MYNRGFGIVLHYMDGMDKKPDLPIPLAVIEELLHAEQ